MKNKMHVTHKKDSVTLPHLHQSISGIPFPASRKDVIEYSRNKGASTGIMYLIEKLPEETFRNESEIISILYGEL